MAQRTGKSRIGAYYVEHAGKRIRFRTYEDALEFGHAAADGDHLVFIVKGWISQTLLVVLPQELEAEGRKSWSPDKWWEAAARSGYGPV
jgi:hypothetical protein